MFYRTLIPTVGFWTPWGQAISLEINNCQQFHISPIIVQMLTESETLYRAIKQKVFNLFFHVSFFETPVLN